jgi:hypothetical protein
MWVAVAVIAVVVLLFGARVYVNRQWYVGVTNGRVAIYHGIPAEPLGINLSHVYRLTGISAARAQHLQPYHDLDEGITANSLQDCQSIVRQIQQDLGGAAGGG